MKFSAEIGPDYPLHSVVQSAVDGKRQRLETFQNKLDVAFISSKSGVDTSRDGTLRLFKNCFFKTKTCCVSTPDHMTAVEYSFNTSGCSVGEVFSKNRLHPGIQSAVDGELHGLEPF